MKKSEIAHIESQVKSIREHLSKAADPKAHEAFLTLLHKPGYTSVAEAQLITAMIDAVQVKAKSLADLQAALHSAASKVELNPQPLPP